MNQMRGFRWDAALPALTRGNLAAHLLLLQNLRGVWLHAIDPPMWSVATEWQIYFLFPVLLLPIWRRFGNLAMVGAAFAIGLLPHFVLHSRDFACPWFLGLFALGASAAVVSIRPSSASKQFLSVAAWVCLLLLAVFFAAATFVSPWLWGHLYVMDAGIGLLTAVFLCFCTGHSLRAEPSPAPAALRLLQTPAAALLGAFSYSLYLVHFPVLSLLHLWLRPLHLSPVLTLLVLIGAGAPLCLLLSYLFHLRFERPFMPGSPHNNAQAEKAAVASPAP